MFKFDYEELWDDLKGSFQEISMSIIPTLFTPFEFNIAVHISVCRPIIIQLFEDYIFGYYNEDGEEFYKYREVK